MPFPAGARLVLLSALIALPLAGCGGIADDAEAEAEEPRRSVAAGWWPDPSDSDGYDETDYRYGTSDPWWHGGHGHRGHPCPGRATEKQRHWVVRAIGWSHERALRRRAAPTVASAGRRRGAGGDAPAHAGPTGAARDDAGATVDPRAVRPALARRTGPQRLTAPQ